MRRGDVFRGPITIDGNHVSAEVDGEPAADFHESRVRGAREIRVGLLAEDDPLYLTDVRVEAGR